MRYPKIFFFNKKILIYGFGISGISTLNFLKKDNKCFIVDDYKKNFSQKYKKYILRSSDVNKDNFDYIILSPGIDSNKCKLKKFIKKNYQKVITELDVFNLNYPKNVKITITGTNGKSTTAKLIYDIFKKHKYDVRLVGNIGKPILNEKNIKNSTLFVIEASSYQLDYSQHFNSNYSIILNISPDHLERHGTINKYAKAKFKLVTNQSKDDVAVVDNHPLLKKMAKKYKVKSRIKFISIKNYTEIKKYINNPYFLNIGNLKNSIFVFELTKHFKFSQKKFYEIVNNFKPLKFRQQIIYNKKNLTIINDSKSTSFSSTLPLLDTKKKIYWLLGGLPKKGDKLKLKLNSKKNIQAFIYGNNKKFFISSIKNKIKYHICKDITQSLKKIFNDIRVQPKAKRTILFSPSAASFDKFKNFEERGEYFNKIINKFIKNEKIF